MRALARLITRRRWLVLSFGIALLVAGFVIGGQLVGNLHAGGFEDPDSEASRAIERIEDASGVNPAPAVIALLEPGVQIDSGEGRAAVESVAARLLADPDVEHVTVPFGPGGEGLISEEGTKAYLMANFGAISDDAASDAAGRIQGELADRDDVLLGGFAVTGEQAESIIEDDLVRAETVAFLLVFLLALWVFRSVVAALLPALMGALTIFGAFLVLGLLNEGLTISVFALNLVIGLSLGLAIDYSLLIVNRYREEIAARGPGVEALSRTMQTAGRSVLFSAITVAAALAGLMIFPQGFLFSMGLGGVAVAGLAAFSALVVLPAVLALLGTRVNALAPKRWRRLNAEADKPVDSGVWYRLSQIVMRRPGMVAGITAVALIVAALPAFRISFTTVDASILPESASARIVSTTLDTEFPQDRADPVILAISAPDEADAAAQVEALTDELAGMQAVSAVSEARPVGPDIWQAEAVLATEDPFSPASRDVVEVARATPDGLDVLVGGVTANFIDEQGSLASHLPWAIAVIAVVTMVALFVMTGSLLLPVKAVVMNMLTLGATLGILVFVFQDGRLQSVLSYEANGSLDQTQPILLGAIAFGLSTDYAVFLLSRIKEAHDAGLPNSEAVPVGLQRTGRIVTAAALLFAVAIGAFATSDIKLVKELGVGTAVAVLIDATIIRAFLVPSLMGLLGDWNWWAPGPLRRLHDRIGFKEFAPSDADEPTDRGPGEPATT